MHAWREAAQGGEPGQEGEQLVALGVAESGCHPLLVLPRDVGNDPELGSPALRHGQGVDAAVAGIPRAHHPAALFQVVDIAHDPAGDGAEPVGQLLLRQARLGHQQPHHADERWGEPMSRDRLTEAVGGQTAQLGQQEGDARPAPG